MLHTINRHALAAMVFSLATASLMTALSLATDWLPWLFLTFYGLAYWAFSGLVPAYEPPGLDRWERALITFALLIGMMRLAPYALQSITGDFAPAVTGDDDWHFQELASLVTSERFPPRLNFAPDHFLHFYYLPWMPGAAIATLSDTLTGTYALKLAYGLTALLINFAAAAILIQFVRHVLGREARTLALVGIALAGAIPDGLFAVLSWMQGHLVHAEWWQDRFGIHNQFSTLTTTLIWVPHHVIAAAALLLAVVLVTEPRTLVLKTTSRPYAAAGLLVGFAAFSSIFVVIGAFVAFLPLLFRLIRQPRCAAIAIAATAVSIPLAYIYLNAEASSGFLFFAPFESWRQKIGGMHWGILGTLTALIFMIADTGWMAIHAQNVSRSSNAAPSPLRPLGLCSAAYLASTAVLSFDVWNNFAMRGAMVPTVLIACWWASALAPHYASPVRDAAAQIVYGRWKPAAVVLAVLALATHANEFATFARSCGRSLTAITDDCQRRILAANGARATPLDARLLTECRDHLALYSLERPFTKPVLQPEDRELLGPGP